MKTLDGAHRWKIHEKRSIGTYDGPPQQRLDHPGGYHVCRTKFPKGFKQKRNGSYLHFTKKKKNGFDGA